MADPDTWSLPEEIVPKVGLAKTEQDGFDDSAPAPSLTELDPSLLRGVTLSASLSSWGKHFASQASSSMYEVQERDWNLSFLVQNLHHFLSHDWKTSRSAKTLSLMFIFNTQGAFLATLPFCILIGFWREPAPAVVSYTKSKGDLEDLLAYPIFLFFFCFWQRLRNLVKRPVVVFLDKLCIAQHNSEQKAKGILGLATFLDKSTNLTILWSPRYFSRLWCCYEIATFLREADTAHGEAKPGAKSMKSTTLFPVAFSWIAVLWAVTWTVPVVWIYATFAISDLSKDSCLQCSAVGGLLLAGFDFVLEAVLVYAGLDLFSSVDGLDRQLRDFNIKEADCFCCGCNHQHPETGETLMCDRIFVYQAVKQWYVRYEDDDDDDALEKFNQAVRTRLRSKVLESVSKTSGVLLPQTMVIYLPCFACLPWISDSVALMREGRLWMPGGFGPLHSLWRCIAIFSTLYTVPVLVTMSCFWIFWMLVRLAVKCTKCTKCRGSKLCLSMVLGATLTFLFGSINLLYIDLLVRMEAEDLVDFVPFINFPLLLLNFYLYKANSCTCRRH